MRAVRDFCLWLIVNDIAVDRTLYGTHTGMARGVGTQNPEGNLWIPMGSRQLVIEVQLERGPVRVREVIRFEGDPTDARVREIEGWIADAVAERDGRDGRSLVLPA